jgi:hypothetical protein
MDINWALAGIGAALLLVGMIAGWFMGYNSATRNR